MRPMIVGLVYGVVLWGMSGCNTCNPPEPELETKRFQIEPEEISSEGTDTGDSPPLCEVLCADKLGVIPQEIERCSFNEGENGGGQLVCTQQIVYVCL